MRGFNVSALSFNLHNNINSVITIMNLTEIIHLKSVRTEIIIYEFGSRPFSLFYYTIQCYWYLTSGIHTMVFNTNKLFIFLHLPDFWTYNFDITFFFSHFCFQFTSIPQKSHICDISWVFARLKISVKFLLWGQIVDRIFLGHFLTTKKHWDVASLSSGANGCSGKV